MPMLDVDGVTVNFPFEPYSCQVTYMEKVIKCLKEVIYNINENSGGHPRFQYRIGFRLVYY